MEKPNRVATGGELRGALGRNPRRHPAHRERRVPGPAGVRRRAGQRQVPASAPSTGAAGTAWSPTARSHSHCHVDMLSEHVRRKPIRPAAETAPGPEPEAGQ